MIEKKFLRQQILTYRQSITQSDKENWDKSICTQLNHWVNENKPKVIHTFLPMKEEINLYPFIGKMLDQGKTIVTPKTLKKPLLQHLVLSSLTEITDGVYGTKHPLGNRDYTGQYDLIIVPGLAFDKSLNRLGYGAGYYDNFLKLHPNVPKIGICYPFQRIDKVPTENHDQKITGIISPLN